MTSSHGYAVIFTSFLFSSNYQKLFSFKWQQRLWITLSNPGPCALICKQKGSNIERLKIKLGITHVSVEALEHT